MKSILILASEYAKINEFSFEFSSEHIKSILEMISIVSAFERSIIYKVFEYEYNGPIKNITNDLKDLCPSNITYNEETSEYTKDVLDKISQISGYGVDISDDTGYLPYTGVLPFDYEESLTTKEVNTYIKKDYYTELSVQDVTLMLKRSGQGFKKLGKIKRLKKYLNAHLLNQENAVEVICDALVKSEHIQDSKRPNGIFLFLGPPATGKTYLAQLLSENFSIYSKHIVIDMTQYTNEDSAGAFYGTSRQYGNAAPGLLTQFVRKNPQSIIIFDEIEKAHVNIQNALLSIMSSGYLEDQCGWCSDGEAWSTDNKDDTECELENLTTKVDFSQTMLIFTSNLGQELYNNEKLIKSLQDTPTQLEEMLYKSISKKEEGTQTDAYITAPLLSRLRQGNLVLFNKLDYTELKSIASKSFELEKVAFEENYNIKILLEANIVDILLLAFAPKLDVRAIKSSIGKAIFDRVTDYYMQTGREFLKVKVKVDTKSQLFLNELLQDVNGLTKELRHKNRSLFFDIVMSETKTILKLKFKNLRIITVKNPEHFKKDGISIEVPNIMFSNIAGHNFVKKKLQEVVTLLKDYKILNSYDITVPKGMLLYGPPGTGKTMLAKALANEADLPFISTTGKDLLEEGKIERIFSIAREYAPSIIFIDEIDSVPSRESHQSASLVINTLLTNIDGFETYDEPIFIIAATNMKNRIDEALLRSGRLDIHVEVAALDRDARRYFLEKMLEKEIFDTHIDLEDVLVYTTNLNGSDLEKVERESVLFGLKNKLTTITQEILIEQINIIKYGRKIDDNRFASALIETAYHEAGHAVVSKVLNPLEIIEQITVMPRSNALGFVSFSENEHYINQTKGYFENKICISLAGRIAQAEKFGSENIDSGASSDLEYANKLIYQAITRYGMDESLVNLNVNLFDTHQSVYKNDMIFQRMQVWLNELTKRTETIVQENWKSIETLANLLVEKEQVDGEFLTELLK